MGKVRQLKLLIGCFIFFNVLSAQMDTMHSYGFATYQEAADTLFQKLLNRKFEGVKKFTVNEPMFIKETRKHDTVIVYQMIRGQYISYWGRVERTFKKTYKRLKKSKYTAKKTVYDTMLIYKNSGNSDVLRAELYFSQKRSNAWVKFQLWQVEGLWYFTGRFELVEEKKKK